MSNQINDGGPAFSMVYYSEPFGSMGPKMTVREGMSLRDYFAASETLEDLEDLGMECAVALAGQKPEGNWKTNPIEWLKWEAKWRAAVRFIRSDAMLKAREVK